MQMKLNELVQSNDTLLYTVDSTDMWIKVNLTCYEALNKLRADFDVKIDKGMSLTELDELLQKLTLDIWNRCSPIFLQNNTQKPAQLSLKTQ